MKNLLNIELSKLFSKTSTYIVLAINFGLIFLGLITASALPLSEAILSSSGLLVFSAILISGIMSDVHNGTMKNIVGAGFSRNKIFISKILTSFVAVLTLVITNTIGEFILYLISGNSLTLGLPEIKAFLLLTFVLTIYAVLLVGINFMVSGSFGTVLSILVSIFLPMLSAFTMIDNKIVQLIFGTEPSNISKVILKNGITTQSVIQTLCVTVVFFLVAYISMMMFKKKEIK